MSSNVFSLVVIQLLICIKLNFVPSLTVHIAHASICIVLGLDSLKELCRMCVHIKGTIGRSYSVKVNSPWCTVLFISGR